MILACVAPAVAACLAPAPTPAPPPPPPAPARQTATSRDGVWDALAECESHGQWDYDPATATWGSRIYEGGVQFLPDTWDAYRDPHHPEAAYLAPRDVQIDVAERVLAEQGWRAWPHCSRELGLR